jgi:hypothetical protein
MGCCSGLYLSDGLRLANHAEHESAVAGTCKAQSDDGIIRSVLTLKQFLQWPIFVTTGGACHTMQNMRLPSPAPAQS